jgi:hypothetical protein
MPADAEPDSLVLAMARVDRSGRLSNRELLEALGWRPGHRVDMDVVDGVLMIASAVSGPHAVRSRGELAVPVALRQMCRITAEASVLLAASVTDGVLVVYPATLVARLLVEFHSRGDSDG